MTSTKAVSQKTIIELKRVLEDPKNRFRNYGDLLYERDFPDWFILHATHTNLWDWMAILVELRRGSFFFARDITGFETSIIPAYAALSQEQAMLLGEFYIQRLAAFGTTLPGSDALLRSLQLDGFDVDQSGLKLVPLEGAVSAQQEEDNLTRLVRATGVPNVPTVLKHIEDAHSLYAGGKYHASLNECRNLIQALIDEISTETSVHGKHATKLPGGTANRIEYLKSVGFLTPDEEAAYKSGWGSLSAGSHPGVPEREQARIGLVLSLEFGQLLVLKFVNWKANSYMRFK